MVRKRAETGRPIPGRRIAGNATRRFGDIEIGALSESPRALESELLRYREHLSGHHVDDDVIFQTVL